MRKLGHHEMEINHTDLLVLIILFSEDLCKHKLNNFLKQFSRICSGTNYNRNYDRNYKI